MFNRTVREVRVNGEKLDKLIAELKELRELNLTANQMVVNKLNDIIDRQDAEISRLKKQLEISNNYVKLFMDKATQLQALTSVLDIRI